MTIITQAEPKRRGKYKVRHDQQGKENRTIDGIVFDSAAEGKRYWELKQLQRSGVIDGLKLQPIFDLIVGNELICKYHADFLYWSEGKEIVEDVKGVRTREFIIKKRLMKALLNIDVQEV